MPQTPAPYPIIEVRPEWLQDPDSMNFEHMGSKPKFWYRSEDSDTNWLFKYPRENTGEHWAEKIAAEVSGSLGVFHAKVELATYKGDRGAVTESFSRRGRELLHGNNMLAILMSDYDAYQRFGQSHHTLTNIWMTLDSFLEKSKRVEVARQNFASYLILDALIGNTDRHHENWGVHIRLTRGSWTSSLVPSFDHASSLGRELTDTRREHLMSENSVGRYSERGRGGIYWSEDEGHGPSPLDLVRRAVRIYPTHFSPALLRLQRLNDNLIEEIVRRVPMDWMSESARKFATELMLYNLSELRKIPL